MQKVKMLKTLHGVLAGEVYPRAFEKDKEYEINDSLVVGFMEQGGCELLDDEGEPVIPAGPANRETKVTGPTETKPAAKPLTKMSKPELAAFALAEHGLELIPDDMTAKEMIAAIETKAVVTKPAA